MRSRSRTVGEAGDEETGDEETGDEAEAVVEEEGVEEGSNGEGGMVCLGGWIFGGVGEERGRWGWRRRIDDGRRRR